MFFDFLKSWHKNCKMFHFSKILFLLDSPFQELSKNAIKMGSGNTYPLPSGGAPANFVGNLRFFAYFCVFLRFFAFFCVDFFGVPGCVFREALPCVTCHLQTHYVRVNTLSSGSGKQYTYKYYAYGCCRWSIHRQL